MDPGLFCAPPPPKGKDAVLVEPQGKLSSSLQRQPAGFFLAKRSAVDAYWRTLINRCSQPNMNWWIIFLRVGVGGPSYFCLRKTFLPEKIAWFFPNCAQEVPKLRGLEGGCSCHIHRLTRILIARWQIYLTNLGKSGSQHYAWQWKYENSNFNSLPSTVLSLLVDFLFVIGQQCRS